MPRDDEALRAIRESLMWDLLASKSPDTLFEFQVRVAREIQASEARKSESERWHRRRLRNIGDAVAWRVLTAHAIRNLAVGRTTPVSLASQGAAFEHVVTTGRAIAMNGMNVIISDVTNCIAIGDLLVCGDPGAPFIIECKLSSRPSGAQMQGRRGRQFSRAKAVGKYLGTGRGAIPGVAASKIALEVTYEAAHSWDSVVSVVSAAMSSGLGVAQGDRELIWAVRRGSQDIVPKIFGETFPPGTPVHVGFHTQILDGDDPPNVPHPLAWPVAPGVAFALAEMDVVLCHAVAAALFDGPATSRARLCGVVELAPGVPGVAAQIDDQRTALGPRFLADVLLGFETVKSSVSHMLRALEVSADALGAEGHEISSDPSHTIANVLLANPEPGRKPRIHLIETREDLERFRSAEEAGDISDNDSVIFGPELLQDLGTDNQPPPPGALILVGAPPKKGE